MPSEDAGLLTHWLGSNESLNSLLWYIFSYIPMAGQCMARYIYISIAQGSGLQRGRERDTRLGWEVYNNTDKGKVSPRRERET